MSRVISIVEKWSMDGSTIFLFNFVLIAHLTNVKLTLQKIKKRNSFLFSVIYHSVIYHFTALCLSFPCYVTCHQYREPLRSRNYPKNTQKNSAITWPHLFITSVTPLRVLLFTIYLRDLVFFWLAKIYLSHR